MTSRVTSSRDGPAGAQSSTTPLSFAGEDRRPPAGGTSPPGRDVGAPATIEFEEQAVLARERARRRSERLWQIGVFVLIVGGWEAAAQTGFADPFFFGQPSGIARTIWRWVTRGTPQGPLWAHVVVTLEETILAFLIGVVLGVVAGFALGRNRTLAAIFGPYVRMGNAIPRVILGSIFVIWLGLGMASKVALGVTLTFFVVFFNAFQGVREVDPNLINNARVLGASARQLSFDVMLPSALSWITSSLHTSFGFALVGAVVGEFIGSNQGLGYLVAAAQGAFNANGVFAAMVILSVVALIADTLVTRLEHRLTPWRPPAQRIGP
jgi:NitT/TauT family transport system permease protein